MSRPFLSARATAWWRTAQIISWILGFTLFLTLIFKPALGLLIFWNFLIPVAPALLVISTGLWRNICPLATTSLFLKHLQISKPKKMDWKLQAALQFVSALALYIIVPLRHICFNHDGIATASLLAAAAAIAITMGVTYEWKSGWCASLCPIHPVERLYGQNVLVSLPNAHCTSCVNCSVPCPDSTPNFHPAISNKSFFQKAASLMIIGGLPGFIWGWFHTPDHQGPFQWQVVLEAYLPPLMGMTVSIISYSVLKKMIAPKHKRTLISLFAALGVSCYYWYRIPSLFGFGLYKDDGCLIDLTQFLPHWMIQAAPVLTTCFFLWWFLARKPNKNNWLVRPAWAPALSKKQERDKAELFHENLRTISSK